MKSEFPISHECPCSAGFVARRGDKIVVLLPRMLCASAGGPVSPSTRAHMCAGTEILQRHRERGRQAMAHTSFGVEMLEDNS